MIKVMKISLLIKDKDYRVLSLFLLLLLLVISINVSDCEEQCFIGPEGTQICQDNLEEDEIDNPENCKDSHEQCEFWAKHGECEANSPYMHSNCAKSCNTCVKSSKKTSLYGEQQKIMNEQTKDIIEKMHTYMIDIVFTNTTYTSIRNKCQNRHTDCAHWASIGECEANPKYMTLQCAPACNTCEQLEYDIRCPFDKDAPKAWEKPGDVTKFFTQVLEKSASIYEPTILSGPKQYTSSPSETILPKGVTIANNVVIDGPWVITLENFLSDDECQYLIDWGHKKGYERSMDVGKEKFDGTFDSTLNPRRTSTNAWCSDDCYNDTKVQEITLKMENLINIPSNNSEYFQILKYEEGQEYMQHHDFIPYQLERPMGVRILTVFFYLNTVEDGGGTKFPKLDLTVEPVRGRVLLWPSVKDDNVDLKDPRTDHQALPVEKGIKYGANAWIHQRDYKTPYQNGCQ